MYLCTYILLFIQLYIILCITSVLLQQRANAVAARWAERNAASGERNICMYVCMCVYIYRERERERYIDTCVYIYIFVYISLSLYIYIYIYIYMYHMCAYIYIYIYIHIGTPSTGRTAFAGH